MKQKYNLNEDVEVRFMGKVTEIKIINNKARYCVTGDNFQFAMVDESNINRLLTPEDLTETVKEICDDKIPF